MKNFTEIIRKLKAPSTKENFELLRKKHTQSTQPESFKISKEVSPYNLYLYLFSRFKRPNGLLSLVREEDSDQLFHWDYSLYYDDLNIQIICSTYRIEVLAPTSIISTNEECISFLKQLVKDIPNYKSAVVDTRKTIENWEMIVNPFARTQKQINILLHEVENLNNTIPDFKYSHINNERLDADSFSKWIQLTEELSAKTFSLQCLVPVYIETFVNFVIQILTKQEIKDDKKQFDDFIREHIDVKIQSLYEKCIGFISPVDWENDICKSIHTIFNKRNDLLHGNFNIKDLKYGEVGFIENMPLLKSFSSFQEDILNLELSSGNLDLVIKSIEDAQVFMMYVLMCLEKPIGEELKLMLESYTLGWNKKTKRFGKLFNDNLVDFMIDRKNV